MILIEIYLTKQPTHWMVPHCPLGSDCLDTMWTSFSTRQKSVKHERILADLPTHGSDHQGLTSAPQLLRWPVLAHVPLTFLRTGCGSAASGSPHVLFMAPLLPGLLSPLNSQRRPWGSISPSLTQNSSHQHGRSDLSFHWTS